MFKKCASYYNGTRMKRMLRIFTDFIRCDPQHPRHPRSMKDAGFRQYESYNQVDKFYNNLKRYIE
jgi:hypothetical protein